METEAPGATDARQTGRRAGDLTAISGLLLLLALAAAAFGQGAFFSGVRLFIGALLALAFLLAVAVRPRQLADPFVLAGVLLGGWALARAWLAGTPASGIGWALFGAGTVAVVSICRRLDANSRATLLGGLLAVGVAVALTGWLGAALHMRPWGLPSQGLWRAASTLTYANATAGLLVSLALVALARLAATPRSVPLSLVVVCLLTGTGLTLSRAGIAALGAGLLVLCWLLGWRRVVRAVAGPAAGAVVALLGVVPFLRVTAPARPVFAVVALAAGLGLGIVAQRTAGWKLVPSVVGAVLASALLVILVDPRADAVGRALTHARLTLASPARSGEAAAALRVIATHPLAGAGPGQALRWTSPGGVVNADKYVHDEYLQVFTDLGIAGAALAAFLLFAAGRLLWRARGSAPDRALWAGAVAASTAFAIHSGFDFLWHVPAIPLTVAALVGLAIRQPAALKATQTHPEKKEESLCTLVPESAQPSLRSQSLAAPRWRSR